MTLPKECLEVRKQLFQEYYNRRENFRQKAELKTIKLTEKQEAQLISVARKQFFQRGTEMDKVWFRKFHILVDKLIDKVKISSLPKEYRDYEWF
jgi:hypothetical protein